MHLPVTYMHTNEFAATAAIQLYQYCVYQQEHNGIAICVSLRFVHLWELCISAICVFLRFVYICVFVGFVTDLTLICCRSDSAQRSEACEYPVGL